MLFKLSQIISHRIFVCPRGQSPYVLFRRFRAVVVLWLESHQMPTEMLAGNGI